ncbi:MAG: chemotaxis protein CheC [Magnetococcus sp. YQC-5]
MITILSELEQDALLEVLNIGMGQAADSLSQMVGEEVLLSVPRIFFMYRHEVFGMIEAEPMTPMAAVRQTFSGPFQGAAMLIYPHKKSLELVRALLREQIELEECRELEQESLTEVGNIILNACLGSIANIMEIEMLCDLPEYLQGTCDSLLVARHVPDASDDTVLLLYVDFMTNNSTIKGYVVLLFDTWTLSQLKTELVGVLSRY